MINIISNPLNKAKIYNAWKKGQGWTPVRRSLTINLLKSLDKQGFSKVSIKLKQPDKDPVFSENNLKDLLEAFVDAPKPKVLNAK